MQSLRLLSGGKAAHTTGGILCSARHGGIVGAGIICIATAHSRLKPPVGEIVLTSGYGSRVRGIRVGNAAGYGCIGIVRLIAIAATDRGLERRTAHEIVLASRDGPRITVIKVVLAAADDCQRRVIRVVDAAADERLICA